MIRSMFTAISSLNLHQYFMDVVADNLANANTPTFKSSRVSFQDQFAQTLWSGSAPTAGLGGLNPAQVGLGLRLGTISPNFTQGALQNTGRENDLAIQGDGFFVYSKGDAQYFSRDGSLTMDSDGYLVNGSSGMRLQGWQANGSGSSASIDTSTPLGDLQLPLGTSLARATTAANLAGNLNSTSGSASSYEVTVGVYDSLGALHSVNLSFTHQAGNTWNWTASGTNTSGSGSVSFDPAGQHQAGGGTISITGTGGAADLNIAVNLSGLTQLAHDSDISIVAQDGLAAGSFSGYYVTPESGEIYGVYSNGMQQLIGQLGLATFVNPHGLIRTGQNIFETGPNSGDPSIGAAGTSGRGSVAPGSLEASNVDLGQEFTNMILAQRGFQASSRVITTSDEMLQELVNLKR
jgi:flagellar hook protein FlgE